MKLHLCSQWLGVRFVSYINVRYKAENALLFFSFELLCSDLLRGVSHSNRPLYSQNVERYIGHSLFLPGFDGDGGAPLCKSFCGDGNLIRNSWRDILECKRSIVLRYNCERIVERFSQEYGCVGNCFVVTINHCTEDTSWLGIRRCSRLR